MKKVAVLFCRSDSIYKKMPNVDVYDQQRDALTFPGGMPIVGHPPCRAWGQMRGLANPPPGERELAIWCINQIRANGGVLEHPRASLLWKEMNLPTGKKKDKWGGFSISVDQSWWGHRARKNTMLYICGIRPKDIPPIPMSLKVIEFSISSNSKTRAYRRKHNLPYLAEVTKAEREHTPEKLAEWLIELARNTTPPPPQEIGEP